MGAVNIDNTGTGSAVTLSSNGTQLLLNGSAVGGGASALTIDNKTGAYTVVSGDLGKIINCTANSFTVSLTAAATLGSGFNCWIWNTSNTSTDVITIDPSGAETIDGVSTLTLYRGEGMQIVCNGTNWQTGDKKVMRGYADNFPNNDTRPVASGDYSVSIGGGGTTASNTNAVAVGRNATASGNSAIALGNSTASGTGAITVGTFTTASGSYAVAIGRNSAGSGAQAASGSAAMALCGSYASGTDSFAAAVANNTSSYGATGASSIAIGELSSATAQYAIAIGRSSLATQNYAVSFPNGRANLIGKFAIGVGAVVATGIQHGIMNLYAQTSDATATVLTSNNSTAGTTNQVILANDSTMSFRILVVARRTDVNDESAGYEFTGVVDRNATAGTTAIVGTVTKTVLAEDTSAWDVNVTADTTNGGLKVEVTGEAGKTIRWLATCWTAEVIG